MLLRSTRHFGAFCARRRIAAQGNLTTRSGGKGELLLLAARTRAAASAELGR